MEILIELAAGNRKQVSRTEATVRKNGKNNVKRTMLSAVHIPNVKEWSDTIPP